ncbi:T-complex protein 10 C-terminus-domain-containing protein [Zopfochytrium polystomum]|nr:T-complex protein 10 C-terminus-domain-containing protein [Zopfochytrium polystomum]
MGKKSKGGCDSSNKAVSLSLSSRLDLECVLELREREEIEALRQENQELRKKIRELEQDGSTTAERCRDRVEMLKRRVMELEEEVRILEGERMAAKESELRVVACPPTAVKKHVRGPSGGHEPLTPEQHKQAKTFLDLVSQTEGLGPYIRELRVDEKLVRWYQSGTSLSWSRNGQVRQKCPDGRFKIFYENGDYREFSQGRTVYWYADRRIIHTTSEDHLHTLEYLDSGQVERYYPDGTHEVAFADGTMKFTFPNGREECVFPDGTVQRVDEYGCRTIAYVDGSKEIFFDNEKKTVFPDGTIKAAKRASYNSAAQIMESSILADSKRASTR